MLSIIKKLTKKKSKSVKLAEAVFAMMSDEEWASLKFDDEPDSEDVRVWILELAEDSKCNYSMKKSLEIAKKHIEKISKMKKKGVARADIYQMFTKELYKASK